MGLFKRIYGNNQAGGEGAMASYAGPTIGEAVAAAQTDQAAPAVTHEVWGRPGRCPRCKGFGYLDRIDVVDRVQYEHCTGCFHKWSVAEVDTVDAR